MTASEALVKFYERLGWNPQKYLLDPKKVKVSEEDYHAFIEALASLQPERSKEVRLMLLNYGPSCGYSDVKKGTVRLYSGWIKTA